MRGGTRSSPRESLQSSVARRFVVAVVAIAVATAAAMAILWPRGDGPNLESGVATDTESAQVVSVSSDACPPPQPGTCLTAEVELETGPDAGSQTPLALGASEQAPDFDTGDAIQVAPTQPPAQPPGVQSAQLPSYLFSDFERGSPMLWLAAGFILLVVIFGRVRGVLSLLGLAVSLAIVLVFVLPAILHEEPPLAVALAGAMAVMLITVALAHGLGPKSLAAIVGTATSLLLVAGLAAAFTELTHLTGLSSEEATLLQFGGVDIDYSGLLLAGMVIATLGVLDDVTVSQASTVMAIRAANPEFGTRELYRRALVVGRDHLSATVNTLVLAYVGASLPILLIFNTAGVGLVDAVNFELVAKEIVGTLVGSIGLIAAVPLTTLTAATLARGIPAESLGTGEAHAH